MLSRRIIRSFFILTAASAAGCSALTHPFGLFSHSHEPQQATPVTAAPPQTQPAVADEANDAPTADALAAKVADYTRDVEPRLHQPTTRPQINPAATQPVVLNSLDWLKPQPLRLYTYPQETDAPEAPVQAAPPEPIAATPDANLPVAADQAVAAAASMRPEATETERRVTQRARDYPKDLDGQLDYQLLLFLDGQPVPQPANLAGLHSEDRELLSAVMDGLTNFRAAVRSGDNVQLASKVRPLVDMADRLRSQSELNLPAVALCSEVDSFGVYKPMDSSRFIAGRANEMIVYCEVQNFQSRLTSDNQWQTQLTEEMVLYTDSGLPVWPAKSTAQPVTDLCHQLRHDFFIAKRVTLPANLTIGRFVLKLTVTDQLANRVAETTTPIEIVAE